MLFFSDVYHLDGVLYTVCELSNELTAHAWPSQQHLGTLSTLGDSSSAASSTAPAPLLPTEIVYADPNSAPPADPPRAQPKTPQDPQLAAEILLDNDGFIYVTNRNEPDSQGDRYAILSSSLLLSPSVDAVLLPLALSIAVFQPHPNFKLLRRIHTGALPPLHSSTLR